MDTNKLVALEITTALIKADPDLIRNADPQLVDRRIKAAFELFEKVSAATKNSVEKTTEQ